MTGRDHTCIKFVNYDINMQNKNIQLHMIMSNGSNILLFYSLYSSKYFNIT